jgi:kinesin family protein C2/C3
VFNNILGGDSKTLMFVQLSPANTSAAETMCSLNFAARVRNIELGPAKQNVEDAAALKYKDLVPPTVVSLLTL